MPQVFYRPIAEIAAEPVCSLQAVPRLDDRANLRLLQILRSAWWWVKALESATQRDYAKAILFLRRIREVRPLRPEESAVRTLCYLKMDDNLGAVWSIADYREGSFNSRLSAHDREFLDLYIERLSKIAHGEPDHQIAPLTTALRMIPGVSKRIKGMFSPS